jgi:hypothetical protein
MKSIDMWVVKKQEELKSLGSLLNNFDFNQLEKQHLFISSNNLKTDEIINLTDKIINVLGSFKSQIMVKK